jgi:murein DD-endopeptidase MepM/ murein hydrolase activator NlpD
MSNLHQILQNCKEVKVINALIDYSDYTPLNLTSSNTELENFDLSDANAFENYIEQHLANNNAKVAFGGYKEVRNIYKRSTVFKNDVTDERNIHIGLDLWIKAGTDVLAALDGKIHSFQDNTSLGDYGPTIIVEHTIEEVTFYTLYGHLNAGCLEDKKVGQLVKKGEVIAQLGAAPINGDYAPHLHFQIIKDMQGKKGDYPGVCSIKELDFYAENCPDANLLLKIQ